MEYPFSRLRKNHTRTALLSVIMDVVAKEERKGDKVFDGGEGVQMDLKIADLPRQFQSLTGHFR